MVCLDGDIPKVDSFINHQIDPLWPSKQAGNFTNGFKIHTQIDKILTIETSGIAFALCAGYHFNVPVVFAKKHAGRNMSLDVYQGKVYSYTKRTEYTISIAKQFLSPGENILVIDDFLANGQAVLGLLDIARQACANLSGVGIVIEKGFQPGGKMLRSQGVRVESLVVIDSLKDNNISFREA